MSHPELEGRPCTKCRQVRPITLFPFKKKGNPSGLDRAKTCQICQNPDVDRSTVADEEAPLPVTPLRDFLAVLKEQHDKLELEARVEFSEMIPTPRPTRREISDMLSKEIWDHMNYRFT